MNVFTKNALQHKQFFNEYTAKEENKLNTLILKDLTSTLIQKHISWYHFWFQMIPIYK